MSKLESNSVLTVSRKLGELQFGDANKNKKLSTFACEYCTIHDPSCVLKCIVCKKWFCNGSGNASRSHIVDHLIYAKHTEVAVLRDGDTDILECCICGMRHVFGLGLMSAGVNSFLSCRHPYCLAKNSSGDANLYQKKWKPIIEDERHFFSWFVKIPTERDQLRARQITSAQIAKLEELWKDNIYATIADVDKLAIGGKPHQAPSRYKDVYQYQYIFGSLIKQEADYHKRLKESQTEDNVTVHWEVLPNQKVVACLLNLVKTDRDVKIRPGDELRLRYVGDENQQPWSGVGHVIKIPDSYSGEVRLEMKTCPVGVPLVFSNEYSVDFTVDFIWNLLSFDRMQQALKKFATDISLSYYIYHRLLGHDVKDVVFSSQVPEPKHYSAPNLKKLNLLQVDAVNNAIRRPISVIKGAPGTGKTLTSATIVYQLVKLNGGPVLVCAPTNAAIDELMEKIHKTNLNKVVKVGAKYRERIYSPIASLSLHNQLRNIDGNYEFKNLLHIREKTGKLAAGEEKRYKVLKKSAERKILDSADVICCTCIGAGDYRLARMKFHSILIHGSFQATEPECLIPIVLGTQKLILVGDHYQLDPIVRCKEASKAGLRRSLPERLIELGITPVRLDIQYRMHPELSRFTSDFFYEGNLRNGISAKERELVNFPWPSPDKPTFFWVTNGTEESERSVSGMSYANEYEACSVEKLVTEFLRCGLEPERIGVITPYVAQISHVVSRFRIRDTLGYSSVFEKIEVATVDAFQGREKDIIIISCVRSNNQDSDFLNDPRRVNVALTRAKYGLIIVGNPTLLSKLTVWNQLLNFYQKQREESKIRISRV